MARIRTLKPEILEDEKTAGLSDAAFRLFVALIVLADDYGNVRADPRWLEGQVWWTSKAPKQTAAIVSELALARLVEPYDVRGQGYVHIRSWTKHQRIDNAGKPRVPLPSEGSPISADIRGEIPLEVAAGPRPRPPNKDPEGDPERTRTPPRSAITIPAGWAPREDEVSLSESLGVAWEAEAAQFRDHHRARGTTFKDWNAAFRTWIRNSVKFSQRKPAQRLTALEAQLERVRMLEEQERKAGAS